MERRLSDEEVTRLYRIFCPDENAVISDRDVDAIKKVVAKLKDRDYEVVNYRFGLHDGCPRNRSEVAKIMGVTQESVLRHEAYTLRKLRESILP